MEPYIAGMVAVVQEGWGLRTNSAPTDHIEGTGQGLSVAEEAESDHPHCRAEQGSDEENDGDSSIQE